MRFSIPNVFVRLEGLSVLVISVALYFHFGGQWVMFWLIAVPDAGILAYLINTKAGSIIYNLFHFYAFPLSLIAFHFLTGQGTGLFLASFLWTAHIGLDRFSGFGLKYPAHFKDTHLQRI